MATIIPDSATTLSPPALNESTGDTIPISPVGRQGSFPHRTVSAAPVHAFIDTATPAINDQPVELDGTLVSPVSDEPNNEDGGDAIEGVDEGEAMATTRGRRGSRGPGQQIFSPGTDDVVMDELTGVKGEGLVGRQKRMALLSERSKDPAVLVDIPQTPGATEIAIAVRVAREGSVTSLDGDQQDIDTGAAQDEVNPIEVEMAKRDEVKESVS